MTEEERLVTTKNLKLPQIVLLFVYVKTLGCRKKDKVSFPKILTFQKPVFALMAKEQAWGRDGEGGFSHFCYSLLLNFDLNILKVCSCAQRS